MAPRNAFIVGQAVARRMVQRRRGRIIWLMNRTPARRWGEVEELAPAAVFLASDASRFVNGHILYVDGGVLATL